MEVRGIVIQLRYSRVCVYTYVMEIIGECPKENADEAAKRLSEIMIESAKPLCSVPMKCDCYKFFVA